MDAPAFEQIVRDTLEQLPARFRYALENVAIVVDEEPGPGLDEVLGLYEGTPLSERGADFAGMPAFIRIYRGPILRACESTDEIAEEIRKTVMHELGHHMGLDDDEMPY